MVDLLRYTRLNGGFTEQVLNTNKQSGLGKALVRLLPLLIHKP